MSKSRIRAELVRGDPLTSAVMVTEDELSPSSATDGLDVRDKLKAVVGIDLNGNASCYLIIWGMLTPDAHLDPDALGSRWFISHFGRFPIEDADGYPSWVETFDCDGLDRFYSQIINVPGAPLSAGSEIYKYTRSY